MSYRLWEVWNAKVKFEDSEEVKKRPVVVIGNEAAIVISLKMTGTSPREEWGEYPVVKWKEAGLTKPTTVRCSKVLNLTSDDLEFKIGRLHPVDIMAIQDIINRT